MVVVQSTDLDAKLGLGTGGVTGATSISVLAGRDVVVDVLKDTPSLFRVNAARDATLRAPTVRLDAVTSGRDLSFGSTTGDFTLLTALSATRNITVSAAGALRVGDVRADAGSVSLLGGTVQAGNVSASEDLILRALTGGVTTTTYKVGRDLIVQGSTLSLGSAITPVTRDLSITSPGAFTLTTPLSAGRNLILDVGGKATIATATAGVNIRILAGDLDLTGTVTAPTAQIESRSGAIRVGGSAGDTAGTLTLDNTDFGQLRISGTLRVFAGSTTSATRGDLVLQSLSLSPTATPNVAFLVGSARTARVTGTVAPTASGGIIRIGDATDKTWQPTSILINGALGAATFTNGNYTDIRAFDEVRLSAGQDILFGSERFITLIQGAAVGDIDIATGKPVGTAPTADERFRVFVATGRLEVSSTGKVVQQNTAAAGSSQPIGIYFTGKFTPALIIDPPKLVDLFGVVASPDGKVLSGSTAGSSLSFVVVDASGATVPKPDGAAYKFNSCDVGTRSCSLSALGPLGGGGTVGSGGSSSDGPLIGQLNAGILAARDALPGPGGAGGGGPTGKKSPSPDSQTSDEAGAAALAPAAVTSPPVLLSVAPVDADEIVQDPVTTGTGSEEIWRQRRQKK